MAGQVQTVKVKPGLPSKVKVGEKSMTALDSSNPADSYDVGPSDQFTATYGDGSTMQSDTGTAGSSPIYSLLGGAATGGIAGLFGAQNARTNANAALNAQRVKSAATIQIVLYVVLAVVVLSVAGYIFKKH